MITAPRESASAVNFSLASDHRTPPPAIITGFSDRFNISAALSIRRGFGA